MIVYKALDSYEGWDSGGPEGTRYNVTKSGWFYSDTFKLRFAECFLARATKQTGPKIMFGDNISSHFNRRRVVELAQQHEIHFIRFCESFTSIWKYFCK